MNTYKGTVCVDCLMVIANGDDSGISDLDAWTARVDATNPTADGRYYFVPACDEDCDSGHFSGSRCDYCGTTLAGDRHDVAMLDNQS